VAGDIDAGPPGLGQHAAKVEDIGAGATAHVESGAFSLHPGAQDTLDESAKVRGAAIGLGKLAPVVIQVAVFEPGRNLRVSCGGHSFLMPFDRFVAALPRVFANRLANGREPGYAPPSGFA